MDIEKALKLITAAELLAACHEAERRNVEIGIVKKLYRLYREADAREKRPTKGKSFRKS